MSKEGILTKAVIFLGSVVGGYWLISHAAKKEMLADSDVFPSDAEKMMYEETSAKTIIPYALYEFQTNSSLTNLYIVPFDFQN